MKIKKLIGLIITFTLLTNIGFGQSQKSFDKLILETNEYLKIYDTLYAGPNSNYLLNNFDLSKKQIKEVLEANYDGSPSLFKDSISGFAIVEYYKEKIYNNLNRIIHHNKFIKNDITKLISSSGRSLAIIVSTDKKLYNFSLDGKNVGTYILYSSMHYTEIQSDSIPNKIEFSKGVEIGPYAVFRYENYDEIYSIETKEGTKYILIGFGECSTHIKLVSFKNGIFKQDFTYPNPFKSCWEGEIKYNSETKKITINYTANDITTNCDCTNYAKFNDGQDNYYFNDDSTEQINEICHCVFKFNGLNFELIKKSWEKIKE